MGEIKKEDGEVKFKDYAIKLTEDGQSDVVVKVLELLHEDVHKGTSGKLLVGSYDNKTYEDKYPVYVVYDKDLQKWVGYRETDKDDDYIINYNVFVASYVYVFGLNLFGSIGNAFDSIFKF